MSFEGVKITKLEGGLGRTAPSDDNVMMLVAALETLPATIINYKPYKLIQPRDAELLGFNESFDANEKVLVKHRVDEFFRLSPDGELWLVPVPHEDPVGTPITPQAVMAKAEFKAALREAAAVKGIGFAGFAQAIAATVTTLPLAQAFVAEMALEKRLVDFILLEGQPAALIAGVNALPDLRTNAAPNVSVVIAQDPAIAALDALYANYSAIGSALGMLSVRQVNENLGSVNILSKPSAKRAQSDYPLTEGTKWASASLSNGLKVVELSGADKKALTDKGYIYAGSYDGYGGVFFNSSPTATVETSDYAFIENNRVWNKAARLIRTTLLPEIKGTVKKDPTTGYIRSTTISRWSGLVNAALEKMNAADEISGYDVYINPKQVLSASSPLVVKAQVVVDDIVHEMDVELGLTSQIV